MFISEIKHTYTHKRLRQIQTRNKVFSNTYSRQKIEFKICVDLTGQEINKKLINQVQNRKGYEEVISEEIQMAKKHKMMLNLIIWKKSIIKMR